jgi:3-O-methylgallate 3,4-dioxygenase
MAKIVIGIGTSHSPALNSSAEDYAHHAEQDFSRPYHLTKDGKICSYQELLATAEPSFAEEITLEKIEERVAKCTEDIEHLASTIAAAELDALIVIGDDQKEQYHDENMPSVLIYTGTTIQNLPSSLPANAPAYWKTARVQFHEASSAKDYPVASTLGRHLTSHLTENHFDVSHGSYLSKKRGEGHAFGFVHKRLMKETVVPILHVILNTYYPPNQPRPSRCIQLGQAISDAIDDWPKEMRIGILASGGLSHVTIDEELDRGILDPMARKDHGALSALNVNKLNSGSSEIRNWLVVAGAVGRLQLGWYDYQPCYRTPAGNGCGMAFAIWF